MAKVDPWSWFYPIALLMGLYGCQQEHIASLSCSKPTMYQGFVKGLTEGDTAHSPVVE